MCRDLGIEPLIKVAINSGTGGKGTGDAFGMAVREQLGGGPEEPVGDLDKDERRENHVYWKESVNYGLRTDMERVVSVIKRLFGEHLRSRKWENMVQEIKLNVPTYNRWLGLGRAAA